jgi:hypothetical protein
MLRVPYPFVRRCKQGGTKEPKASLEACERVGASLADAKADSDKTVIVAAKIRLPEGCDPTIMESWHMLDSCTDENKFPCLCFLLFWMQGVCIQQGSTAARHQRG